MGTLDREIGTYRTSLAELSDHVGAYVLIKDATVLGFFPTRFEALAAGCARFVDEPFLVRQVLPAEPIHAATRNIRPG